MSPVDEIPSTLGLLASGNASLGRGPDRAGDGAIVREIPLGAGTVRVLISGESSDGRLEMFEFRVPPGQPGPGPHVHVGSEECFTLLDGSANFRVGTDQHTLIGGQSLVVPRCVPHSWRVVGDVPLVMLVTFTPAIQMEAYFADLSDLIADIDQPPTPQQMQALWSKYDTAPCE